MDLKKQKGDITTMSPFTLGQSFSVGFGAV
jgi:hypothetical protein